MNSLYERLVRIVFFSTFRIIHLFRLFELSTSWWEVKMIDFTEYIRFFRLFSFRPLGGRSNDQFHWICWIFSTFFDLLLGGQTDRFYWICWIVRLFNLLLGGLIDWVYRIYWNFSTFRLFELLVKWWEVKMIDFSEYIRFFRLSGGQNDRFYRIYLFFSTFQLFDLLVGGSKWSILLNNVFFDFPTFRPLDGGVKIIDFTIGFFWLFDFVTPWWEVKMIKFTEYIGNFSTFRLFDLLLWGQNDWYYWI